MLGANMALEQPLPVDLGKAPPGCFMSGKSLEACRWVAMPLQLLAMANSVATLDPPPPWGPPKFTCTFRPADDHFLGSFLALCAVIVPPCRR